MCFCFADSCILENILMLVNFGPGIWSLVVGPGPIHGTKVDKHLTCKYQHEDWITCLLQGLLKRQCLGIRIRTSSLWDQYL